MPEHSPQARRKLGILGGMGPLASAEFVRTLYRLHAQGEEQHTPTCILASDPTFPDRTAAILDGDVDELTRRLIVALEDLLAAGGDPIVIACVTIHHVLPRVPEALRRRVVSLIDVTLDEVLKIPGHCLMLSTTGTQHARLFEQNPRWPFVDYRIATLDAADQEELHATIYRLKAGAPAAPVLTWLDVLAERYSADVLIFGCTELHLLQPLLAERALESGYRVIDPLLTLARQVPSLLAD